MQFIQLLVKCAANPDPEVTRRTFDFWYRLKKSILSEYRSQPEIQALQAHFVPCYAAVFDAILGLLKCPDDFDSLLEAEQEDFRRLRNEVADVLQDCCEIGGGDQMLARIFSFLQKAAQNL